MDTPKTPTDAIEMTVEQLPTELLLKMIQLKLRKQVNKLIDTDSALQIEHRCLRSDSLDAQRCLLDVVSKLVEAESDMAYAQIALSRFDAHLESHKNPAPSPFDQMGGMVLSGPGDPSDFMSGMGFDSAGPAGEVGKYERAVRDQQNATEKSSDDLADTVPGHPVTEDRRVVAISPEAAEAAREKAALGDLHEAVDKGETVAKVGSDGTAVPADKKDIPRTDH